MSKQPTQNDAFQKFIKEGLNEPQRRAVRHLKGALQVVAGAGSGKTRVITARIANLIHNGALPESIVALTFTNKAAEEMRERITKYLGPHSIQIASQFTQGDRGLKMPFVGTFHSYCLLMLRRNPTLAPIPGFTIMDADDQQALIKKILKRNGLEKQYTANKVQYGISSRKNKLMPDDGADVHPMLREVYHAYEKEKADSKALDFDDLLLHFRLMLKKHAGFTAVFQDRVRHILVDEYQDTNLVQHDLLKLMSMKDKKLAIDSMCVVGDEDQSIYSWRGAEPANMLTFQDDFNPVTNIRIEQNYRSVKPILDCANAVIKNNIMRNPKELWSSREASGRIISLTCRSDYQEAEVATSLLKRIKLNKKLSEVAILYRTHFQSRVLEEMLISGGVPYRIIGGTNFYSRKEIKDVLAYMRLVVNPYDRVSFFRVVNTPLRGLGQKFEQTVHEEWLLNPLLDFTQLLTKLLAEKAAGLTGKKAQGAREFLKVFDGLHKDQMPSEVAQNIIHRVGYYSYLGTAYDEREAETKQENVREFLRSIDHLTAEQDEEGNTAVADARTLEEFLHEIALMQEKMEQQEHVDEAVQLMTLHGAKGLEFDTVLLVGLEEGLFPSSQSLHAVERLEEERRLFYVGMTRAKERLVLSHAMYRNQFGQVNNQMQSRFLGEVPKKHVQELDISSQKVAHATRFFAAWLSGGRPVAPSIDLPKMPAHIAKRSEKNPTSWKTQHYKSKYAKKAPTNVVQAASGQSWYKNQSVAHKTFGTGLVVDVENNADGTYYITAIFRVGKKKVRSDFLTKG